jgi:serine protease inhibitor
VDASAHDSEAFRRIVTSSNDVGFRVLSELVKEEGERNLLISPLSVCFALCMLYNGAGGATKLALRESLAAHGFTDEAINDACLALRSNLLDADSHLLLRLANALWAHESLSFDEGFVRTVRRFYAADVRSLDFGEPSTVAVINEWAREQTDGKICPLLTSDDISAATECVLCAAVYFKGAWAQPFARDATRAEPFHLAGGLTRDVSMMSQEGLFLYQRAPDFEAVVLPYGDGRLSMYVLLPAENCSPAELVRRMDERGWEESLTSMKEKRLTLFLPRFKLAYEVELNEPLAKMGLGGMFASGADFGPMGLANHEVEKFKHKTMIEVNEEGAEAAAVSAVLMGRSLAPSKTLRIDRPFFWAIRDNRSHALVFTGLVHEPD